MERRAVLLGLMAVMGAAIEGCGRRHGPVYAAGPRRRVRRRVRRHVRRRIRRRVAFRMVTGRRVAVVPLAVAVGWELSLGPRVVVVREVRPTTIIVADAAG